MGSPAGVYVQDTGVFVYDHHGNEAGSLLMAVHTTMHRVCSLKSPETSADPDQLAGSIFYQMVMQHEIHRMSMRERAGIKTSRKLFAIGSKLRPVATLITINCICQRVTIERR